MDGWLNKLKTLLIKGRVYQIKEKPELMLQEDRGVDCRGLKGGWKVSDDPFVGIRRIPEL